MNLISKQLPELFNAANAANFENPTTYFCGHKAARWILSPKP